MGAEGGARAQRTDGKNNLWEPGCTCTALAVPMRVCAAQAATQCGRTHTLPKHQVPRPATSPYRKPPSAALAPATTPSPAPPGTQRSAAARTSNAIATRRKLEQNPPPSGPPPAAHLVIVHAAVVLQREAELLVLRADAPAVPRLAARPQVLYEVLPRHRGPALLRRVRRGHDLGAPPRAGPTPSWGLAKAASRAPLAARTACRQLGGLHDDVQPLVLCVERETCFVLAGECIQGETKPGTVIAGPATPRAAQLCPNQTWLSLCARAAPQYPPSCAAVAECLSLQPTREPARTMRSGLHRRA
jgi:hypothetical protein